MSVYDRLARLKGSDLERLSEKIIQEANNLPGYKENETANETEMRVKRWDHFMEMHKADFAKFPNTKNFLHLLAHHRSSSNPNLDLITSRAIILEPQQMGMFDDETERTPLAIALENGNLDFFRGVIMFLKQDQLNLVRLALEKECSGSPEKSTTCLFAALNGGLKKWVLQAQIWEKFCSIMPEKMFTEVDSRNCTPLHAAVEYRRSDKRQVAVVKELLVRAPIALKLEKRLVTDRLVSVYQYHMYTRLQTLGTSAKPKGKMDDDYNKKGRAPEETIPHLEPVTSEEGRDNEFSEKTYTGRADQPAQERGGFEEFGQVQRGLARTNTNPAFTEPGERAALLPPMTKQTKLPSTNESKITTEETEKLQEQEEASKEIRKLLKLFYLRTETPEKAFRSLHVPDEEDLELWFDFGPPREVDMKEFLDFFAHLKFNNILQYVAFPQVTLKDNGKAIEHKSQGRKEMIPFFEWLSIKGVERIIKVIVDDLESPSHADEVIEKCLEPFTILKSVEILDWRKLDLDPQSLRVFGKDISRLHLQWSGRNAVLRAWSEKEGLCLLPKLREIHITQVKGLESNERLGAQLDAFRKRLRESWPEKAQPPQVYINSKQALGQLISISNHSKARQPTVNPHKWLRCMDDFVACFRQIKEPKGLNYNALKDDVLLKPVIVALIDDGTDIAHPDLRGRKIVGKSFCHYQEGSTWRVAPYWNSASGHGTLMARLIRRICPTAIIHVIKLQTYNVTNSAKPQIDQIHAVEAIKYASDIGAHIISISWTIKPPKKDEDKANFNNAIHNATSGKGILMFCAASDQGKTADLTYPHIGSANIFRIGAAKPTGSMSDAVGDGHNLSFIFPGHNVLLDDEDKGNVEKINGFQGHSGSSVATALAAGLSALIIECVRVGCWQVEEAKDKLPHFAIERSDLENIRKHENMKYAMNSLGTDQNTNYKYIEVWKKFEPWTEKLKKCDGSRSEQLEVIASMAFHLLNKSVR